MEIVEKKPSELKEYENNPRNNDDAVPYVKESIKNFGFKVPIIIDKNNVIIAGHTRLKAAKELKLKKVPCIYADDLTDEQVKAFRLADNKVSEFSNWNFQLLDMELAEISMDMKPLGFTEHDEEYIDDFFEKGNEAKPNSSDGSYTVTVTLESEENLKKLQAFLDEMGVDYKVK